MAVQKTFGIIKPDSVKKKVSGKILSKIEENGLAVVAIKKLQLSKAQAEMFYEVHRGKPFYEGLVEFMISGPVFVMALEGENAIAQWRTIMGATDPAKAAEGTLRKLYGANVGENAVHGSDAPETAAQEISFFFSRTELVS